MSFSLSNHKSTRNRREADLRADLESENSQSSKEEMGIASAERPEGTLIWFAAPSVTKAVALSKLIRHLAEDWQTVNFLLTTPRSRENSISVETLPPRCTHQFSPTQNVDFTESFLAHWKPDICVATGLEVTTDAILCVSSKGIPLFLIDAKLDPKRFGGMRDRLFGHRAAIRDAISKIDYIDSVDAASAKAFRALGADEEKLRISGPMDEVSSTLPYNEEDRNQLASRLVGRPIWLASNVPEEEDHAILAAHIAASRTAHRLLLIFVPDVNVRGSEIAGKLADKGVRVRLRSLGELPDDETQVYIADTIGERGLWFRLATVSFLGSSLVSEGSVQSPFEAAGLGSAIIHGPNLGAYQTAFNALNSEGGARQISNAKELPSALLTLLAPDKSAAMAHSAWDLTTKGARATDFALTRIESMLEDLGAY